MSTPDRSHYRKPFPFDEVDVYRVLVILHLMLEQLRAKEA